MASRSVSSRIGRVAVFSNARDGQQQAVGCETAVMVRTPALGQEETASSALEHFPRSGPKQITYLPSFFFTTSTSCRQLLVVTGLADWTKQRKKKKRTEEKKSIRILY